MHIGYVPYSKNLEHPGDRRRLKSWAQSKSIELNITSPLESDVLVLSGAANFGYWIKRAKQPIVLDIVDGYLGEEVNYFKDIARNILRTINGTSNLKWLTYSRHLRFASKASNIVVVASPEQANWVKDLNSNIAVILDDHSELLTESLFNTQEMNSNSNINQVPHLFWEGYGYNLKHFEFIAKELDAFLHSNNWGMYLITSRTFARWGGFVGRIDAAKLIRKLFPLSWRKISIIPWTLTNLQKYSQISQLGIIPISPNDNFAQLKSENKLLSMWLLDLPVLFSDTPAYSRVANLANQQRACVRPDQWSSAISKCTDPNNLECLRINAKKYVSDFHTHDLLILKWQEVFRKLEGDSNAKI
jgi:hypothetical protein